MIRIESYAQEVYNNEALPYDISNLARGHYLLRYIKLGSKVGGLIFIKE